MPTAPRFYLISDRRRMGPDPVASVLRLAVEGLPAFQWREKDLTPQDTYRFLQKLLAELREAGATTRILVNDRIDIALALGIGVHIPEEGLPTRVARQLLGADALIGRSTHSIETARRARDDRADFVTFSPVYDTASKRIYGPPQGLDDAPLARARTRAVSGARARRRHPGACGRVPAGGRGGGRGDRRRVGGGRSRGGVQGDRNGTDRRELAMAERTSPARKHDSVPQTGEDSMSHILWYPGHELLLRDIVRAENCHLFDSRGNRYVDLESGVWCTSVGHGNPRIRRAIGAAARADRPHGVLLHERDRRGRPRGRSSSLLGFESGKCVFLCSGSEAVEYGVRVAQSL